ncbi:hypothetical protein C8J57DRAFT_1533504 [Mycena rebaudengoi]|nr:hypothetical protein C8J57DRAFT_1533504 [Mycena rebaudengoi]
MPPPLIPLPSFAVLAAPGTHADQTLFHSRPPPRLAPYPDTLFASSPSSCDVISSPTGTSSERAPLFPLLLAGTARISLELQTLLHAHVVYFDLLLPRDDGLGFRHVLRIARALLLWPGLRARPRRRARSPSVLSHVLGRIPYAVSPHPTDLFTLQPVAIEVFERWCNSRTRRDAIFSYSGGTAVSAASLFTHQRASIRSTPSA